MSMRRLELREQVASAGATNDTTFVPFYEVEVGTLTQVRISLLVEAVTGAELKYRRRIRYSDDGVTWDAPITFDSDTWLTDTTDWSWGGSNWVAPNTSRQLIQYGLEATNASGTDVEAATVLMILDVEE